MTTHRKKPHKKKLISSANQLKQTVCDFSQPVVGDILDDRYELIALLGRGGMGIVYKANDRELEMDVAIKILPLELAGSKKAIKDLKSEAKLAMMLRHPSIVALYHFAHTGAVKYLVMELLSGCTLEDKLHEEEILDPAEVISIVTYLAEAIDYAHSQRVVHRDIKPDNIFIHQGNGEEQIRLMDFGIARQIKESMTRLTRQDSSGTILYMAPEQMEGNAVDGRADIYALGATVYECLAGNPPFYKGSISYQIANKAPTPIDDIPKEINDALMIALAKDREDRFATAADFANALAGVKIEDTPAAEVPPSAENAPEPEIETPVKKPDSAGPPLRVKNIIESTSPYLNVDGPLTHLKVWKSQGKSMAFILGIVLAILYVAISFVANVLWGNGEPISLIIILVIVFRIIPGLAIAYGVYYYWTIPLQIGIDNESSFIYFNRGGKKSLHRLTDFNARFAPMRAADGGRGFLLREYATASDGIKGITAIILSTQWEAQRVAEQLNQLLILNQNFPSPLTSEDSSSNAPITEEGPSTEIKVWTSLRSYRLFIGGMVSAFLGLPSMFILFVIAEGGGNIGIGIIELLIIMIPGALVVYGAYSMSISLLHIRIISNSSSVLFHRAGMKTVCKLPEGTGRFLPVKSPDDGGGFMVESHDTSCDNKQTPVIGLRLSTRSEATQVAGQLNSLLIRNTSGDKEAPETVTSLQNPSHNKFYNIARYLCYGYIITVLPYIIISQRWITKPIVGNDDLPLHIFLVAGNLIGALLVARLEIVKSYKWIVASTTFAFVSLSLAIAGLIIPITNEITGARVDDESMMLGIALSTILASSVMLKSLPFIFRIDQKSNVTPHHRATDRSITYLQNLITGKSVDDSDAFILPQESTFSRVIRYICYAMLVHLVPNIPLLSDTFNAYIQDIFPSNLSYFSTGSIIAALLAANFKLVDGYTWILISTVVTFPVFRLGSSTLLNSLNEYWTFADARFLTGFLLIAIPMAFIYLLNRNNKNLTHSANRKSTDSINCASVAP